MDLRNHCSAIKVIRFENDGAKYLITLGGTVSKQFEPYYLISLHVEPGIFQMGKKGIF